MSGTNLRRGNTLGSLKNSNRLRRGFAFVLTVAMLYSNMVFAPTHAQAAGSGVEQPYLFQASADVEENEAQLGTNLYFGDNVTDTERNKARFVYTDGWLAMPDGPDKSVVTYNLMSGVGTVAGGSITNKADHYGVGEEFRLISKTDGDGTNVDDGEANGAGDTEGDVIKVPTEMLELYLNDMNELNTAGLGAVNLSLVCGFFAPAHNHESNSQSNENNVGVERQLKVFVSLDGETWLEDSVGVRSSTLLGGGYLSKGKGLNGVFYRVETEDLLDISGVAGETIKKIKVMPFGESQRTSGQFRLNELAVNPYKEEDTFHEQVPSDVTYIEVDGDTLRQIAVEEALRTAQTEWTTEEDVTTAVGSQECIYYSTDPWGNPLVHHGPPYEQRLDSTRELFQSRVETGVWEAPYNLKDDNGKATDNIFGMDCQTFVFNAVSRVSRSYAWSCMHTLNAPYTSIVGPHLNVTELPRHTDKDILIPSEDQAVYEAYSLTDAGDIVDSYGFGLGHTRLVKSSHTVYVPAAGGYFNQISAPEYEYVGAGKGEYTLKNGVYTRQAMDDGYRRGDYDRVKEGVYEWVGKGNGSYNIDPDQSSVVCTHQASIPRYAFRKTENGKVYDKSAQVNDWSEIYSLKQQGYELLYSYSSRDNDDFTFTRLLETGYAPFTMNEYSENRVEKENVQVVLGSTVVGEHFAGNTNILSISSNYRLISYEIDLVRLDYKGDPIGDPLYSTGLRHIMEANIMTQALLGNDKVTGTGLNTQMANLSNGRYRINVSVDSGPITELGDTTVPRTVVPIDFEITNRETITYSIEVVDPDEGGTIQLDRTSGGLGDLVTVTATPDVGYELSGIVLDGEIIEGNSFIIQGEHEVTALFEPIVYTVQVGTVSNGTVRVDKQYATYGKTVTVTAEPAENYVLDTILVDGEPIDGNTFTVKDNHVVTARFVSVGSRVTVIDPVGGTVTTDKLSGQDGETVTIDAVPDDHYKLKAILVNGEELNGTQFTLNGDTTVTAQFARLVQPGDVMYFPGSPMGLEYVEGYLVSSDTPDKKIFFYFEDGFTGN